MIFCFEVKPETMETWACGTPKYSVNAATTALFAFPFIDRSFTATTKRVSPVCPLLDLSFSRKLLSLPVSLSRRFFSYVYFIQIFYTLHSLTLAYLYSIRICSEYL